MASTTLDADDPLFTTTTIDTPSYVSYIPSLEELVDACCRNSVSSPLQQDHQEQENNHTQLQTQQQQQQQEQHHHHHIPSITQSPDPSSISTPYNTMVATTKTSPTSNITPENFQIYVNKSHCEENLQFLIEIYRYEFIWNKLFQRRSSILKCKSQRSNYNHTLNHQIVNNNNNNNKNSPILTLLDKVEELEDNNNCYSSNDLINKIDLSSNNGDVSSFVNLELTNSTISLPESWNNFDHSSIRDDSSSITSPIDKDEETYKIDADEEDEDSYLHPELKANATDTGIVKHELIQQWKFIISHYITPNAPSEINLPFDISQLILHENDDKQILYHSPEILIQAKNYVLQLLRENIYEEYLDLYGGGNDDISDSSFNSSSPPIHAKKKMEKQISSTSSISPTTSSSISSSSKLTITASTTGNQSTNSIITEKQISSSNKHKSITMSHSNNSSSSSRLSNFARVHHLKTHLQTNSPTPDRKQPSHHHHHHHHQQHNVSNILPLLRTRSHTSQPSPSSSSSSLSLPQPPSTPATNHLKLGKETSSHIMSTRGPCNVRITEKSLTDPPNGFLIRRVRTHNGNGTNTISLVSSTSSSSSSNDVGTNWVKKLLKH